jgi:hypothetical protein
MKKLILLPVIALILTGILLIQGCVKEDHFGKSAYHEIIAFTLPMQLTPSVISHDSLLIRISVSKDLDLTSVVPAEVRISNFALLSPVATQPSDFSQPVIYRVTAEDGSHADYTILVSSDEPQIQLTNSGFDHWYKTTQGYFQIGRDKNDTVWATGNAGTFTFSKVNVSPVSGGGSDTVALLETLNMGPLAQLIGQGIAAGSLFTGTFVLNIQNPVESARFGTPFIARPDSFSVMYRYAPASGMMNGYGTSIPGNDSVDIAVLIEDRSGGTVRRVATAWHRAPGQVEPWTLLKMKLEYGPASNPAYYMKPTPPAVWGTGQETPTHISVIFSSSARGNLFEGAPGSKLWINDFRLYY